MGYQDSTNLLNLTKYIVDGSGQEGTYTTIQAALNAAKAPATVFVRSGIYAENIVLKTGVNISAFQGDENTVTLFGSMSAQATNVVTCNISGIRIINNGSISVNITSNGANNITFLNCRLIANTNTIVNHSASSSNSTITFSNCTLSAASNLKVVDHLGPGSTVFVNSNLEGASSQANTLAQGSITLRDVTTTHYFLPNGTGQLFCYNINYSSTSQFLNLLTGASALIVNSRIATGSTTPLNADGTAILTIMNSVVDSTAVNTITGTGTLRYANITFPNTRNLTIATQTQLAQNIQPVGSGGLGISTVPSNGQIPIGNGTNYTAATLTASTGISITNAAGSVSIATSGGGFAWSTVAAGSQAIAVNNGYVVGNGAGLVTFSLPASAAIGDTFKILGRDAGGWSISQGVGQQIVVGSTLSTSGVGGSVSSTNRYDCVTITCIQANTLFTVQSGTGVLNVI